VNIQLRELDRQDLPTLNVWRNDPSVIEHLGSNFLYINLEIDAKWYDNYLNNRQTNVRLAIMDTIENAFIGTVQLTNMHPINRHAEFSIMIGDKNYWSKGVGYIAATTILKHGFKDLNLHRIYLTVLTDNERAIGLYEKIGFKKEGILRGCIFKDGTFKDMLSMSILKEDY
jgi:diamine N-acetyltransferase